MKKAIFVSLGLIFFGCGAVGAVLPILPTTPFLLLSVACFSHGSDRFQNWFLNTKLYKKHLQGFARERAMPLKTKIVLCAFASAMLILAFLMMESLIGRIVILGLIALKYYFFIFRIKTLP